MLRGVVLVFSGVVIGNGMRFLLSVLLARHLAAAGFGLFTLAALFSLTAYNLIGLAPEEREVAHVRFLLAPPLERVRRELHRQVDEELAQTRGLT